MIKNSSLFILILVLSQNLVFAQNSVNTSIDFSFMTKNIDSTIINQFHDTNIKSVEIICSKSINEIPDAFFQMEWITSLNIKCVSVQDSNSIDKDVFDVKFNSFTALETLSIIGAPICEIDKEVNFPKLKELNLSFVNLNSIPTQFLHSNLKLLIIENCQINSITKSISEATNLEVLMLNNLPIKCLPKEVYSLKKLIKLGLNGTDIIKISKDIVKLKKLERLYLLTITGIEEIPNLLCKLKSLKEVHILYVGSSKLCLDHNIVWKKKGLDYYKSPANRSL